MKTLDRAKELLHGGGCTCVLINGNDILTSHDRGVAPLVRLIGEGVSLRGYSLADKVVGKAVALLAVYVGITEVYADNMSKFAVEVLDSFGIAYECSTLADAIINREGTDICPMEKAVAAVTLPKDGYEAIVRKLNELKKGD